MPSSYIGWFVCLIWIYCDGVYLLSTLVVYKQVVYIFSRFVSPVCLFTVCQCLVGLVRVDGMAEYSNAVVEGIDNNDITITEAEIHIRGPYIRVNKAHTWSHGPYTYTS